MFGAILKSKFYTKCKTAIKTTKTRIEFIKKKRKATEKFLRKDIIELLDSGLDINAYGRAEGLLVELSMSECYDSVAKYCTCLLHHVDLMDQMRECPKGCREAVPSLMYAAAFLSELPELRKLRSIFLKKYGDALEDDVNQEFVEKLNGIPYTKEEKIQLLQDIASKSGKSWDSKALEKKLFYSPPYQVFLEETHVENKDEKPIEKINKAEQDIKRGSSPSLPKRKINEGLYKIRKNENNGIKGEDSEKVGSSLNELFDLEKGGAKVELDEEKHFGNIFPPPSPYKRRSSRDDRSEPQSNENDTTLGGFLKISPEKDTKIEILNRNKYQNKSRGGGRGRGQERKTDEIKYYERKYAPVSSNQKPEKISSRDIPEANLDRNAKENKFDPKRNDLDEKPDEKHQVEKQDDSANKAKPKQKPVRLVRKRVSNKMAQSMKLSPGPKLNTRPKDKKFTKSDYGFDAISQELAAKIDKSINDYKEENDKEINELLIRYCKRVNPLRRKNSPARRASLGNRNELVSPHEQIENGRLSSYEPERKSLHPNLPTYDEFIRRLAYLRGHS